ncbi:MAG: FKBP-type peptidyl-prolyl cis-trans isomerase [Isosphaeraceae bacterium]|nr:FKBP-type peptidyl-prolyl cis-trans isomerase [Isosphaeraceae bacterium]
MRPLPAAAIALVLSAGSAFAQDPAAAKAAAAPTDPKELTTKASYAYGFRMGKGLKAQGAEFDVAALGKGIADAFADAKPSMTEEEMQVCFQAFVQQVQAKQEGMAKKAADDNKKVGEAYLAANKSKPGVVTTPSGLQYKILKQGTGPKPKATDTVTVHYEGKLIDGKIFDSSIQRGEPASFPLNGVIAGWTEGVQLMPVGSKFQFFIPAALAYGENPRPGGPIGPNAVLTFEVELLKIGDQ